MNGGCGCGGNSGYGNGTGDLGDILRANYTGASSGDDSWARERERKRKRKERFWEKFWNVLTPVIWLWIITSVILFIVGLCKHSGILEYLMPITIAIVVASYIIAIVSTIFEPGPFD
jgi:hypothetical protein